MKALKKKTGILVILGLFIGICTSINAQDYYGNGDNSWRKKPAEKQSEDNKNITDPSGYATINFGFAEPEGSFAASYGTNYGGYALSGSNFHFAFAVPVNHSNFGFALMFGSYTNTYDIGNYDNYLVNSNPNPNAVEYGSVTGGTNNVYSESSIMGGLYATYPIGRLSVDGRFMIGALLNSLPEQAYGKIDSAGNQTIYDLQTSYPTSFAFDAGIGLRYLIARLGRRQLCATFNLDYLYSNVNYTATQIVDYTPYANNPYGNYVEYDNNISGHLAISMMSITFGIGYQFGGGE